ncbi:MAG: lysylphosphatidylglycerol synthase transmembrane domain-containing protein [Candidatus Bathyarchaeia archaeon]
MTTKESPPKQKSARSRGILRIALEVIFMIAILAALLWYVGTTVPASFKPSEPTILKGVDYIYNTFLTIKVEYLLLAFLMYFGINLLFTVRLRRVLSKNGVKTSFGKTLLAQYGGMLTSDVTPGRSGYILTPVYLLDQKVPTSKSLSSVLGIQTFEFLIKVIGGIGAIIYLVKFVPTSIWNQLFPTQIAGINVGLLIAVLGVTLMMVGAIVLAAFTWSKRAISLFDRIANSRFLKRFTGGLMGKLEEYKESAHSTGRAIPEIIVLTVACWIIKGFEWYFLGYALGITQIPWIAYFLIHPLVTALAFVPITPAGIGVQEFGIIGIFGLVLDVPAHPALIPVIATFALLARGLLIFEDLAGVPQIVRSTSLIFSRKKPDVPQEPKPGTPPLTPV